MRSSFSAEKRKTFGSELTQAEAALEIAHRLIGSRLNRYSVSDHANRLRRYAQPWLERIASELNRSDGRKILEWAREQGASSGILRHLKTSINTVYIWGVEEGLIPSNGLVSKSPVYGIGLDCKEERIPPMLTLEEVRKLLLEAKIRNHPWYPIWAMALSTGMRSGELMALEWSDVDFKNGIIRVTKSFNIRFKAVKCPKNGTWRNVDINSQLHELLVDLRRERMNEVLVLPRFPIWKSGLAGKVLRMFLVSIGINKHCVFHTLRACFATHLLSTGVEPLKVMRMGGWSDLKTFQIYLRLSGVDVKGVAEMLDVLPAKDMTANVVPLFR